MWFYRQQFRKVVDYYKSFHSSIQHTHTHTKNTQNTEQIFFLSSVKFTVFAQTNKPVGIVSVLGVIYWDTAAKPKH